MQHPGPLPVPAAVITTWFLLRAVERVDSSEPGRLEAAARPVKAACRGRVQDPAYRGRRVVTFHNQRDFIFFRQAGAAAPRPGIS